MSGTNLQRPHVGDGEDGAGHVPGDAKAGVDHDDDADHQEVQVVAGPLPQQVLPPVDDDGGDLLVHEHQDGAEGSGHRGHQRRVPGVASKQRHSPAAVRTGGLELPWQ